MFTTFIGIALGILGTSLLIFFLYRPKPEASSPQGSFSLPAAGTMVVGDFFCRKEPIHAFCKVEEQKDSRLLLLIQSEMGKSPLTELRAGSTGWLELQTPASIKASQMQSDTICLPFRVDEVNFPWVKISVFPDQVRSVWRESLRVPAHFSVRLHSQGGTDSWTTGTGINFSNSGFCFVSGSLAALRSGVINDAELTITFASGETMTLFLNAEVKWTRRIDDGKMMGMQVSNPAQQRELAKAVARLQRELTRRSKDYYMGESTRPNLS